MSGPIIRVGATPAFSEGWDRIFQSKKNAKSPKKKATKVKGKVKARKKR